MATGSRQDHGDGDDHHLAGAERADLPEAQQGFLPRRLHRRAGPDGEGAACRCSIRANPATIYDEFGLCPSEALRQKLNQAEMLIENWHTLMPLKEPKRSVVKKGAGKRRGLHPARAGQARRRQGHRRHQRRGAPRLSHACRRQDQQEGSRGTGASISTRRRAGSRGSTASTRRGAFSAASICRQRRSRRPARPAPRTALFDWIVSDFGLNDAIEAGLVKTPRVVVRDDALPDARTLRPKLYHIYRDPVGLRGPEPQGASRTSRCRSWCRTPTPCSAPTGARRCRQWQEAGHHSPPVMLTVCNRTETAARIEHYFNKGDAHWPELHAPNANAARRFEGAGEGRDRRNRERRTRTTRTACRRSSRPRISRRRARSACES